jgi:YVTN family beta-propeller protein
MVTFISPISGIPNSRGIVLTPDGRHAYITTAQGDVYVFDTKTNAVTASISNIGAGGLFNPAITPNGNSVYVSEANSGFVNVISTATNTLTTTVTVGMSPVGIAITPNGQFAYVASNTDGIVSVIDIATNTETSTVTLSAASAQPDYGVAITPNGQFAYVTDTGNALVNVINIATNTLIDAINIGSTPSGGPNGIAITPDGRSAYTANGDGSVSVINTTTHLVTTFSVGSSLLGIAITPDGQFAYVTDHVTQMIDVIDIATNTVTATISPDPSQTAFPWGIAIQTQSQPPSQLAGVQREDIFLTQTDIINVITWSPPLFSVPPAISYHIYRNAALTDLAGVVSATRALKFQDHNRKPHHSYTYYIVSVDQYGNTSTVNSITVP